MRGDVCARCARFERIAAEEAKSALAVDLVRGVPSGDNHMELNPMGQITNELLEALEQAKAKGEVIVKITLYETAWTGLSKESSSLKGINAEGQRTFDGIPIFPHEGDPPNIRFVLEPK